MLRNDIELQKRVVEKLVKEEEQISTLSKVVACKMIDTSEWRILAYGVLIRTL